MSKKILKDTYTQEGYSKLTGIPKSTVSRMVKNEELNLVYTHDGKPLIKL
jgi:hypothetical protein